MSGLRSLSKLLLVLNLAVSTQGLLFVQGAFALRRDYIAAHLCVNRDVPESKCRGACFLREQQERQREETERRALGLDVQLAVSGVLAPADAPAEAPAPARPATRRAPAPGLAAAGGVPAGVFHPPRAA